MKAGSVAIRVARIFTSASADESHLLETSPDRLVERFDYKFPSHVGRRSYEHRQLAAGVSFLSLGEQLVKFRGGVFEGIGAAFNAHVFSAYIISHAHRP